MQSPIDHGYRPECECSGCKTTARICAELNNEEAEIFANGYNAAMQSFGNSEQLNSQVTPDCWIPVSERMPGSQEWVIVFAKWANQQVLCWDDVQNRWTDFEDESYYADMFTHWMPLQAPPQK
ncbi:DUF551 domain-containing protein [Salmonella enterica]|nr:DUF551 domain-containing protein [Salmonella enterica]EDR5628573.1 DUF551 domain-containing protein [Salmonella enterica subsp. enterica serovar 4,[5],12:i:-]EEM5889349.1 DUF551 domain-containing protein [Salmonella enterica subsp. enterica serovar Infantis]QDB89041.1 DUF551 domain-containing protein [Salmonella enterica subsp. enterica serovar Typhimurium]EBO6894074.1 DUF551 domain-containing protein [Salmonella enterica]